MYQTVRRFTPTVVVVDPVTNLLTVGSQGDVQAMLTRVIDYLKTETITALFTSLTPGKTESEETEAGISSLMDTWILLSTTEVEHERRREIAVLKSRGMAHSNQIREFALTNHGFDLRARAAQPRLGRQRARRTR
jgi:circadian clock protein KaiC